MFSALHLVTPEGRVLDHADDQQHYAVPQHKKAIAAAIKDAEPNKAKLVVLPSYRQ